MEKSFITLRPGLQDENLSQHAMFKGFSLNTNRIFPFYKNAAAVDIAPASSKITKNVKYRSRAPGQGVF